MKVYAVATSEVQEDSTLTDAEAFAAFLDAERHARNFMFRCVGDFLEIDPADVAARTRALEDRLRVESATNPCTGRFETRYLYEAEGLILSATIQETSV